MECFNPSSKLTFTCLIIIVVLPDAFMPKKTSKHSSSLLPPECKRPLPVLDNLYGCCPDVMVFVKDITDTCVKHEATCEYYKCYFGLLGNDVLYKDSSLNMEVLSDVLTAWVKVNKMFDPAIRLAKRKCLHNQMKGVSDNCPHGNVVFCLVASTIMKCPNWNTSSPCSNFKSSLDACKQLYHERLLEYLETIKKLSPIKETSSSTQLPTKPPPHHESQESDESAESEEYYAHKSHNHPNFFQTPVKYWRRFDDSKESTESEEPIIFI